MTRRPVIGLTMYEEQTRWGVWDVPAVLLPSTYVRSVLAVGGVPVLLPPAPDAIAAAIPGLDGLILTGGPDIDPRRYGQTPLETTQPPRPDRDDAELQLLGDATRDGIPVLGVCRGLQLMNVARGGTLIQHLPAEIGSREHSPAPAVYGRHPIEVTSGTRLAGFGLAGDVACSHHQAISEVGAGLVVSALAADGTIEAIEDPARPFFVGVQWHPEVGTDTALFSALVAAARS
jgi:gamma-glutamyl-gamma-aminobutyrate hydrolase PuuD